MNKNYGKGIRKTKRSFLLLVFLFFLGMTIPPVVAESPQTGVAKNRLEFPNIFVQAQSDPVGLVKQAQTLYQEQQYEAAISLWSKAVEGFARSRDSQNQAMALSNLSLTYQQLGQWEAAESAIAASMELLPADDSLVLAQTLDVRGKLQRETGKSAEALETWQQAANIYQNLGNDAVLAQNNLNQAQALQDLGLYPRACKRLLTTVSLDGVSNCKQLNLLSSTELKTKLEPLTSNPSVTSVSALKSLGELLLVIGQPLQSEQILAASLTSAQKLDAPAAVATTYLSLGNTYQALSEGETVRRQSRKYERQAVDAYSQAASIASLPTFKFKAELNQLNLLVNRQKWTEAAPLWRPLYPQVTDRRLPNNRDNLYARINYGQNLIKLLTSDEPTIEAPATDEVRQVLVGAADRAKALGDRRIEAYAWGSLGRLNEVTGEYTAAEIYTQQALGSISSYDAADVTYQYFWQLGRIKKRTE